LFFVIWFVAVCFITANGEIVGECVFIDDVVSEWIDGGCKGHENGTGEEADHLEEFWVEFVCLSSESGDI
jgi:hypothetical protein